jgi:hypothetical protein
MAIIRGMVRNPEDYNDVWQAREMTGTTEDDGLSVTIDYGYSPIFMGLPIQEISVLVRPYDEDATKKPTTLSVTDNADLNTSIYHFTY